MVFPFHAKARNDLAATERQTQQRLDGSSRAFAHNYAVVQTKTVALEFAAHHHYSTCVLSRQWGLA